MPSTSGPWNTTANSAFAKGALVTASAFNSEPAIFNEGNEPSAFARPASHRRLCDKKLLGGAKAAFECPNYPPSCPLILAAKARNLRLSHTSLA